MFSPGLREVQVMNKAGNFLRHNDDDTRIVSEDVLQEVSAGQGVPLSCNHLLISSSDLTPSFTSKLLCHF